MRFLHAAPDGALFIVVLACIVALAAMSAVWFGFIIGRKSGKAEAERRRKENELEARSDAVRRSRAVLTGQISEQLAPYFPAFPCRPADARFLGKPVDFVAFPGLSEGAPCEVLFIEVKTGGARLSSAETALKKAIEQGRVRWVEYRPALSP